MNKEIEIPEGYEAKIVGNKVVLEPKESEDERIKNLIYCIVRDRREVGEMLKANGCPVKKALSWIAKQEEQKPRSTEETELNSLAFLGQLGYTCIPPGKEKKPAEWGLTDATFIGEIDETLFMAETGRNEVVKIQIERERNWLKSLPERFNLQSNQEWSEEDDALLKEIVSFFKDGSVKLQHDLDLYAGFLEKRLKSLRLQSHWKPTEEQMEALAWTVGPKNPLHAVLSSLYEDLKKL